MQIQPGRWDNNVGARNQERRVERRLPLCRQETNETGDKDKDKEKDKDKDKDKDKGDYLYIGKKPMKQ